MKPDSCLWAYGSDGWWPGARATITAVTPVLVAQTLLEHLSRWLLVVWKHGCDNAPEPIRVIVLDDVRQFVHDDVVDHIVISHHNPPRKVDAVRTAATAPAGTGTRDPYGCGHNAHLFCVVCNAAGQQLFGGRPVYNNDAAFNSSGDKPGGRQVNPRSARTVDPRLPRSMCARSGALLSCGPIHSRTNDPTAPCNLCPPHPTSRTHRNQL